MLTTKEMILVYELQTDSSKAVNLVCREMGLIKKRVLPAYYCKTLGFLADMDGFPEEAVEPVENKSPLSDEMLVFCGLSRERLDQFLALYRNTGTLPIALKAMLTPTNAWWNSRQLYTEIAEEHDEMTKMEKNKHVK